MPVKHASFLALVVAIAAAVQAQPLPSDPVDGITAGTLQNALYDNCVQWRLDFGPLTASGTLSDLRAGVDAQVRIWVGGEDVRAHVTYDHRTDGGATSAPLFVGRHAGSVWCRPAGRLSDAEIRSLIATLCLPFDCDLVADLVGTPPDAIVKVKQAGGSTYYVLEPSATARRWIASPELTVAMDLKQVGEQIVRTDYNALASIGEHGWYPSQAETLVDGVAVTRVQIDNVEPRPHLAETFATPAFKPELLDVNPWEEVDQLMDMFEPAADGE